MVRQHERGHAGYSRLTKQSSRRQIRSEQGVISAAKRANGPVCVSFVTPSWRAVSVTALAPAPLGPGL